MEILNKKNIGEFSKYYHNLHDSIISNLHENNNGLELELHVAWSGEPTKKDDGGFNTHPTNIRLLFRDIKEHKINKNILNDYIYTSNIKPAVENNKDVVGLVLYNELDEAILYVVASDVMYEELKDK